MSEAIVARSRLIVIRRAVQIRPIRTKAEKMMMSGSMSTVVDLTFVGAAGIRRVPEGR
jgi:hypothetical protein